MLPCPTPNPRAIAAGLLLCAAATLHAQHTPLLPQPAHIEYGNGTVALCGLHVTPRGTVDDATQDVLRIALQQPCSQHPKKEHALLLEQDSDRPLSGVDEIPSGASREGYRIHVGEDGVTLHGNSSAGLFYAAQTLLQMMEQHAGQAVLPFAEVSDAPSLPYRGFMMDTAHGAAPTVPEIIRQLNLLARFKANQYYLYVETNIDLDGYPLLHTSANYSKSDIAEIVRYARTRHIDVVPCVELYGHLHDLFRLERYSDRSALPHGGEANPAEPQLNALFTDWVKQYAAMFPSPWFHLGFDEPFELERAGSKRAGGVSPDVLWLQHLKSMANAATAQGKRPLFWADIDEGAYIFNKYPGLAASLPKEAIAVPWFYDARTKYDDLLTLFRENHVPNLVAPGISDWDNVAPDFRSSFINIDGMLAAGKSANTLGMVNTMWSDSAQSLHRNADAAVAYGAVAAWQSAPVDRPAFFDAYARTTYGAAASEMAQALTALTQAQTSLIEALGNETSFRMWDDPFEPRTLARVRTQASALHNARLAAEEAQEHLMRASTESHTPDDWDALMIAARTVDFTAMKFQYAAEIAENFEALPQHPKTADLQYLLKREATSRNHSRAGDLIDIAGELQKDYAAEWNREYKPYRLSSALARWNAEQEYWRAFQQRVWTAVRNFHEGDARPTLQGVLASR